jgi:transcriptional regulator with XRE-family HTH domain
VADPCKILGSAIRKRRLQLGLTQEELAERAGMHWTYISGVERGVRNVSISKLIQIADGLKVRVRELVAEL